MLIIDAIVIAIIATALLGSSTVSSLFNAKMHQALADGEELSFNLATNPKEKRAKAGEDVTIKLSATDIECRGVRNK